MLIEPKRFETGLAQSTSRGGLNRFKVDWPLEVDWSCDCTYVARVSTILSRSMACLALALHAHTRMSSGWTTEKTRALVGVWGPS